MRLIMSSVNINVQVAQAVRDGAANSVTSVVSVTQALANGYGRCLDAHRDSFVSWIPSFFTGLTAPLSDKDWGLFDKSFCRIINKTLQDNPPQAKQKELLKIVDSIQGITQKKFTSLDSRAHPVVVSFTPKVKEKPKSLEAEEAEAPQKEETVIPKSAISKSDIWKKLFALDGGQFSDSLKTNNELDLSDLSSQNVFDVVTGFLEDKPGYREGITLENCLELFRFAQMHGFSGLSEAITNFLISELMQNIDIPIGGRPDNYGYHSETLRSGTWKAKRDVPAEKVQKISDVLTAFIKGYEHAVQPLTVFEQTVFAAYFLQQLGQLTDATFDRYIETANASAPAVKEYLKQCVISWKFEKMDRDPVLDRRNLGRRDSAEAAIYFRFEDWKKAVERYEAAFNAMGVNAFIDANHVQLGVIAIKYQNWAVAKNHYEVALQRNPDRFSVKDHQQLGVIYYRLKDMPKAAAQYEKALQLEPNGPAAAQWRAELGTIYRDLKDWVKAAAQYEKALQVEPNGPAAAQWRGNLGFAYGKLEDWEKAVAQYEKALQLEPNGPSAARRHENLGYIYHELKDLEKALVQYEKALQLEPNAKRCIDLGNIYRELKEWEKAKEQYEKALQLEPSGPFADKAYGGLGRVYRGLKDWEKARTYIEKACDMKPDDSPPRRHANLGYVYGQFEEWEKAKTHLEKALQKDPNCLDAEEQAILARAREQVERTAAAAKTKT